MKACQTLNNYFALLALAVFLPRLGMGQGNLVVNGGFDADAVGWTLTNGAFYGSEKDAPNGLVYLGSQNPSPTTPNPTSSQLINSLIPGQTYNVSGDFQKIIDWSGGTITGLSFGVAIDGIFLFEATPADFHWHNFNFSYTATSSNTVLSLASQINGTLVSYGIDNIALYAVPEPSAELLFGFGLILLLGFGRWKTKAVQ